MPNADSDSDGSVGPSDARSASSRSEGTLLPWLQLLRLPAVFSALSNILCGYLLTHQQHDLAELIQQPNLWLLLMASSLMYLAGMVLNDVFDAVLDAAERPERPIPSGRISRKSAAIFGSGLLVGGIAASAAAGTPSLLIALLLTVAILTYDAVLKNTALGSLGMAACRFLNILLGASLVPEMSQLWQLPQVGIAAGLAVYIAGVTWFARNEAGTGSAASMTIGLAMTLAGVGIDLAVISKTAIAESAQTGAQIAFAFIAANLTIRGTAAIRLQQPRLIQKTVGLMLLSIVLLDAAAVFAATGHAGKAALVVILIIPATLLRRLIPIS